MNLSVVFFLQETALYVKMPSISFIARNWKIMRFDILWLFGIFTPLPAYGAVQRFKVTPSQQLLLFVRSKYLSLLDSGMYSLFVMVFLSFRIQCRYNNLYPFVPSTGILHVFKTVVCFWRSSSFDREFGVCVGLLIVKLKPNF